MLVVVNASCMVNVWNIRDPHTTLLRSKFTLHYKRAFPQTGTADRFSAVCALSGAPLIPSDASSNYAN
jgi:hypothetical protein